MNKTELLKKLLPGFIPLFIFVAADWLWGTKIGIYVAIGSGIIETIIVFIKEKRWDTFIIADTLLLVLLGCISILLDNDIFFKLKPALIEAILCVVLGISAFSKKNLLLLMSKRYLKDVEFNETQIAQFNKSLKIFFYIISVHTLLIAYSAYFLSKEAWVFISGGLFYILFGIYFSVEFIKNKMQQSKYKNEEWFPLVDEEGKVIGKAPRSVCHKNPELLHPVVHLHVFNNKNELFLQKRPLTKDIQPGKWDTAVGGHISLNEDIETALKREANEELGISGFQPVFLAKYIWKSKVESELVFSFLTHFNDAIKFNDDELEDGKFWPISEIKNNIGKEVFTPNFENEFQTIIQEKINAF